MLMRSNFLYTTEIVSLTMEVLLPSSKQKSSLCKETAVPTLASIMHCLSLLQVILQYSRLKCIKKPPTASRPSTDCRLKLMFGAWGFWSKALKHSLQKPSYSTIALSLSCWIPLQTLGSKLQLQFTVDAIFLNFQPAINFYNSNSGVDSAQTRLLLIPTCNVKLNGCTHFLLLGAEHTFRTNTISN